MIGGAPPFALIVEDAARIETQVAADRPHVAVGRPGDDGRWMSRKLGERTDAPTSSRSASASTKRSSATALMSISTGGANDAAADIDHEIGAAAERRAAGISARAASACARVRWGYGNRSDSCQWGGHP